VKLIICLSFCIIFFTVSSAKAEPQPIISTLKDYKASVKLNDKNEMINLKQIIPDIIFDLKYSTTNNFTKRKLYKSATTTYLRKDAAAALLLIHEYLKNMGLGFKIFDAYRPYSVTKLMWAIIHDKRYVANPVNGSGHNKGIAVDITLVNLTTAKELNMGTAFDNFTDTAHHTFTKNLSPEIIVNRTLLKSTMEKFGFKSLETEWWHYSWKSNEIYDVMDINFKILKYNKVYL
jgi:D-alanyl-D-alanine dipeptidase